MLKVNQYVYFLYGFDYYFSLLHTSKLCFSRNFNLRQPIGQLPIKKVHIWYSMAIHVANGLPIDIHWITYGYYWYKIDIHNIHRVFTGCLQSFGSLSSSTGKTIIQVPIFLSCSSENCKNLNLKNIFSVFSEEIKN